MGSTRLVSTHGMAALAIALTLSGNAPAQDAPRPGTEAAGQALNSGGTLAPMGGAVDTTQGGVGGTGLGKMPPGSSDGKGMSVKGPAGQGIQPMQTPK